MLVPKAGSSDLRMCIDYRRLNAKTKKDAYPMPLIEDCLNLCRDADYLTIIDVQDAYYHVQMAKDSRAATAFCTAKGLFEWLVMPFGLCNAPATFQRHVDTILRELIGKICAVFFDDIVVYTKGTYEQHLKDVEAVLQKLASAKLSAKVKKCKFGYREIIFVGHLIKEGKIFPDPRKVDAIKQHRAPRDLSELRSFLGLVNYYRKFIPHFALIAAPLYQLTKKDVDWDWTAVREKSFQQLKDALLAAKCLHGPDFAHPFILQTDASNEGLGAVLTQNINGEEHPIAFVSRQLNVAEKNYTTSEQECLAVVWAVKEFEPYLIDAPFTIVTDHEALKWLPTKRFENKRLMSWAMKLNEFKYVVQHRKGRNNANADFLSRNPLPDTAPPEPVELINSPLYINSNLVRRCPFPSVKTTALPPQIHIAGVSRKKRRGSAQPEELNANDATSDSEPDPSVLRKQRAKLQAQFTMVDSERYASIVEAQHEDKPLKAVIAYLIHKEIPAHLSDKDQKRFEKQCRNFKLIENSEGNGLYYLPGTPRHGPRSVIPLTPRLVIPKVHQPFFLEMYHDSPFGGHLGITRTFRKLSVLYYWEGMFDQVQHYVAACSVCQAEKIRRREPTYMAKRMADPTGPFDVVSMDIMGPLNQSEDFKYVIVFVCHFTRWCIAIPLENHQAVTVANVLLNDVICRYGAPRILLSDNGPEFHSSIMAHLCNLSGISKIFTSSYRPQSNGVSERMVGTIKAILQALTADKPNSWARFLQMATFAYNTSTVEATEMSPYEALYGLPARVPFAPEPTEPEPAGKNPRAEAKSMLEQDLAKAREIVSNLLAKRREDLEAKNKNIPRLYVYQVGDLVWLKRPTKPIVGKLQTVPYFSGAWRVLERVGDVNYKIRRVGPPAGTKSQVVHVSRLKKYEEPLSPTTEDAPEPSPVPAPKAKPQVKPKKTAPSAPGMRRPSHC